MSIEKSWRVVVATLLALVGAITITITIGDDDGDGQPNITIVVNEQEDRVPGTGDTTTLEVPRQAVKDVAASDAADHVDAADETPPAADPEQLAAVREAHDQQVAEDPLELTAPLAATSYPGCRNRFVRNQSSRGGVRPRQIWMHYTVSPNRAGRSDVDGITAYFDRSSTAASSHFVIDRDGHCNYIVPTYRKAWTQAAANPIAISFEIINTGRESPFMRKKGYTRTGYTIARLARQYDIPLRVGSSGCSGSKKGVVMHYNGGACAGGHHDITPFALRPVLKRARQASCHLYRKSARSKRACLRRA
jgi:hypothetical protein